MQSRVEVDNIQSNYSAANTLYNSGNYTEAAETAEDMLKRLERKRQAKTAIDAAESVSRHSAADIIADICDYSDRLESAQVDYMSGDY